MNCKPGDMAVILKPRSTNRADDVTGLMVTVLQRAKPRDNRLPDIGEQASWSGYDPTCPAWLVMCATPKASLIRRETGEIRKSRCFVIWDHRLRPIRPGDISDEEVRDLYAPKLPEVSHV